MSTLPTFSDAYLGDVDAMAKGRAQFNPPTRSADEFTTAMQSLAPILPASPEQVRDLAVNEALAHGIRVHPPSADAAWLTRFNVRAGGVYAIFALDQSMLFDRPAPQTLEIDGKYLSIQNNGGAWTQYSNVGLTPGSHWVSDGYLDPDLVVAIVSADDLRAWQDRINALVRALPQNLATASLVYGAKTAINVPASGKYRVRATAVGPYGPDGIVRTHVVKGSASRTFPVPLGATLPYIVGNGIAPTSALMMPPEWYRDDPTAYSWQRGDPISWFLFARDSHVRVFVPGKSAVHADVSMRLSRLQVSDSLSVHDDAGSAINVALPGPGANDQQYDTVERLGGPVPVAITFPLVLRPGWNDVTFDFHLRSGERFDLGPDVISAAVAPDLAFTKTSDAGASAPAAPDRKFLALRLANPPAALSGDPEIVGTLSNTGTIGGSIAVALENGGTTFYRVFPISRDGSFDINFLHAFPNGWSDSSTRVVGVWFLSRDASPKLTDLSYNLHAMPGENLRQPQSLRSLPFKIDGKVVGAAPVFLTRGRHVVTSADKQVKIGLLTAEPLTLPRTRDFPVLWQRHSSTSIGVTVKSSPNPFLLVFNEAYHPEWSATVNGEVLPHVIVNGVANGWIVPSLPAGGEIAMNFAGQQFYVISGAISVIALLIMITLAWAPDLWPVGHDR
jgi:hypothetical protein